MSKEQIHAVELAKRIAGLNWANIQCDSPDDGMQLTWIKEQLLKYDKEAAIEILLHVIEAQQLPDDFMGENKTMYEFKNLAQYTQSQQESQPLPKVQGEKEILEAAEVFAANKWKDGYFMTKQEIADDFLAGVKFGRDLQANEAISGILKNADAKKRNQSECSHEFVETKHCCYCGYSPPYHKSSPNPTVLIDALNKIVEEYTDQIKVFKGFRDRAEELNNNAAASMWRHKSEGLEKAVKAIAKALQSYPLSTTESQDQLWEEVATFLFEETSLPNVRQLTDQLKQKYIIHKR